MPHLAINGWFWGQTTTGSGQYIQGLLRHLPLVLPDWQLTLVTPPHPPGLPPATGIEHPEGLCHQQYPWPAIARGARLVKLAWEQWSFPRACRQVHADVAFVPYWGSALWSPCPTVVTIHDLIPILLDDYADTLTARAYTWLVAESARRAAAILTVSQAAGADIIQHLRVDPTRVHVTYEGLGVPHAPALDGDAVIRVREKYQLPPRYLLYLGGFDPRKNVPFLLSAYHHAQTMQPEIPPLFLAGQLPEPGSSWFTDPRPLITQLQIGSHVKTLGFVPDEEKPALYSLADLFLFPSRYEGFGLPPLEALSCGTPALVSDRSSLPEVVGDTLTPVPIDDPLVFARAIVNALNRPPEPRDLLAQARKFSWQTTAAHTAEVIRAAAGS